MVPAPLPAPSVGGMETALDHRRVTRPRAGAGARARAPRRGGSSSTPAARTRWRPRAPSWRPLTEVVAIAGDVADAAHRRALVAAAGPRIDLLVNNASVLGPSPQPPLADYPLDALEHVYRVNVLAPLALFQLALPALRAGRVRAQRHLRRRRRGVRGLGRLRLLEGRARAAHAHPRRRASGAAGRRRRPRRHEHADAPGGVPGRGHLRPPAARGERARPAARSCCGDAAERPLPSAERGTRLHERRPRVRPARRL